LEVKGTYVQVCAALQRKECRHERETFFNPSFLPGQAGRGQHEPKTKKQNQEIETLQNPKSEKEANKTLFF
jgi:hypothetical protein